MTRREITAAGLVIIGEFGWGSRSAGWIVCSPDDVEAVRAAYDAIGEGDLGPNTLDGVKSAGGRYVEDGETD